MNRQIEIQAERLKRKLCLGFPGQEEPVINMEKRESTERLQEFKASVHLFGSIVEDVNWYDNEMLAMKKILVLADKLIDKEYKMIYYKFKTKKPTEKPLKISTQKRETITIPANVKIEKTPNKTQRIKRQQPQKQQPTFAENKKETKNNIIYSVTNVVKNPGEFIEKYCKGKTIPFPEYLFEKSNGVYLCRATFLNERFESRYAYEIETAKKDVANLIVSFIRYKIFEEDDVEYKKLLTDFFNKEERNVVKDTESYKKETCVGKKVNVKEIDVKEVNVKEVNVKETCKDVKETCVDIKETCVDDEILKDDIPMLCTSFPNFDKDVDPLEIQDIVNRFSNLYDEGDDFLNFRDIH